MDRLTAAQLLRSCRGWHHSLIVYSVLKVKNRRSGGWMRDDESWVNNHDPEQRSGDCDLLSSVGVVNGRPGRIEMIGDFPFNMDGKPGTIPRGWAEIRSPQQRTNLERCRDATGVLFCPPPLWKVHSSARWRLPGE